MYLTESIETTEKKKYEMVGVIPGSVQMQSKLAALGYREISGQSSNFMLENLKQKDMNFITLRFMLLKRMSRMRMKRRA